MAKTMSAEDHKRIANAIRAAETRTSGEIYCVVARTSDAYFYPAAVMATIGMLLASYAFAWWAHAWWIDLAPTIFVLGQMAAFISVILVLWFVPALRIHLVLPRQRFRRAHENAMKQFLARNVHITARRTGVLIFVSLAERYAEVVADAGIAGKVPQATWNGVVANLIENARAGRLADGFEQAVVSVGSLLAEHFPVTGDDRNELDDHVVEI